jgi:glucokinase
MQATINRPLLVADIGGTNARFGLIESPGAAPSRVRVLAGCDYNGLTEAALSYLDGVRPAAACLAVAAPITGGRFKMNNAPWAGSAAQIQVDLGLDHVELINDFEALALSLPSLHGPDIVAIGPDLPTGGAPMAVLGPGTGLGAAALVPTARGWLPVAGEGGHVDLSPGNDLEVEVMRLLRAECDSGGAELLLSGAGLARLHRLLGLVQGLRSEPLTAADICARRSDPRCLETVGVFCAFLGSFAGNAALTMGARGGVFLGGGILPRIADLLEVSTFRRRFEDKAPQVSDYLAAIPTVLIVAPTPALAGAAAKLDQTLEYAWTPSN